MANQFQNPTVRYIPNTTSQSREIACIEVATETLRNEENAKYIYALCRKYLVNTPVLLHDKGNENHKLNFYGGTKEQQDYVEGFHKAQNLFNQAPKPLYPSEDEFNEAQTKLAMEGFLAE